jgi:hypothetical protein
VIDELGLIAEHPAEGVLPREPVCEVVQPDSVAPVGLLDRGVRRALQ